ncbi:PadR family transcriptional regulator [Roseivirga misakiensis]|uniref:PadR family transcriptional regulator n=1 Tax=Roseivirga misakiensis TaxID=1563681 RepID=A0A1E5SKH5_9BACT|nr:helix-turn-helix transcriptional regulator [Roseivirga misakiensis]OEJ99546.1 PadR family transcriptional regulator [Roseivirga misakiensis]
MKGTHLGEFQEVVLLVILSLDDNAYGVTIKQEMMEKVNRSISRGALHTALTRLEEKGFITSERGEANEDRGGRRKRYYTVTKTGIAALHGAKEMRDQLWSQIPRLKLYPDYE